MIGSSTLAVKCDGNGDGRSPEQMETREWKDGGKRQKEMVSRRENTYRRLHMNELMALTSDGPARPTAWQIWCEPCSRSSIWIWLFGGHSWGRRAQLSDMQGEGQCGAGRSRGTVALHANRCRRAARGRQAVATVELEPVSLGRHRRSKHVCLVFRTGRARKTPPKIATLRLSRVRDRVGKQ
jgi:hypothetical protein